MKSRFATVLISPSSLGRNRVIRLPDIRFASAIACSVADMAATAASLASRTNCSRSRSVLRILTNTGDSIFSSVALSSPNLSAFAASHALYLAAPGLPSS